jgi:hypothetical protein
MRNMLRKQDQYNEGDRFICREFPQISLILELVDHFSCHPIIRYVLVDYKYRAANIEVYGLDLNTYYRRTRKELKQVCMLTHARTKLCDIPPEYKDMCEDLFIVISTHKYSYFDT